RGPVGRSEERRPAAPGVVLCLGGEELGAAAGAAVRPVLEDVVVLAAERPLRALVAEHVVLLARQLGPPLLLGLLDLRHVPPSCSSGMTVSRTTGALRRGVAARPQARED